jgi:hypothetical protein
VLSNYTFISEFPTPKTVRISMCCLSSQCIVFQQLKLKHAFIIGIEEIFHVKLNMEKYKEERRKVKALELPKSCFLSG